MVPLLLLDVVGGDEGFASVFSVFDSDDLALVSDDPLPFESEVLEEDLDEE